MCTWKECVFSFWLEFLYLLSLSSLVCWSKPLLPYWFCLEDLSIGVTGSESPLPSLYYCFSLYISVFTFYILGAALLGAQVFGIVNTLLAQSLYHYVMSLSPATLFCFSVCATSNFFFHFYLHGIFFSIPSVSICVFRSKVNLL